jgi:hypothetical protein
VTRSERPQSFEEIAISTGKLHGAFYLPLSEWISPLLDWVHASKAGKSSADPIAR